MTRTQLETEPARVDVGADAAAPSDRDRYFAPPWSKPGAAAPAAAATNRPGALLRALRPLQWTKNAVVLAALVFAGRLFAPGDLARAALAALAFCAASSGLYLVNDLRDLAADRRHPTKRHRPLAAGEVSPAAARLLAAALVAAALTGAFLVRPGFAAVVAAYAALMLAYSAGLKRVVLLDVGVIAAGFVLRAAGGAVAIGVPISPWLSACAALLALFVGFGKRRGELAALGDGAAGHRASLAAYSLPLLDRLLGAAAAGTVTAYALYAAEAAGPGGGAMLATAPFVAYAVVRYRYLVQRRGLGGSPEAALFADRPLLGSIAGWGLACVAILYLA